MNLERLQGEIGSRAIDGQREPIGDEPGGVQRPKVQRKYGGT